MQSITLKSLGQIVEVMPHELLEYHRLGMGWYAYEKLRLTRSHSEALLAFRTAS